MIQNCKKIKEQKGSITLFVVISMLFFLIVLMGIYVSVNNKVVRQEAQIKQIQESYSSQDINDIYNKRYDEYIRNVKNND